MKSERGFTLIELLVSSMLSIIVLGVAGGILINALSTERTVQSSNQASNVAQLVAQSVTSGVRHASALRLSSPTSSSQVLRALIVDDALAEPAVAHCQAWYYGAGEVRTITSPTAIPVPANTAAASGWTLLADGAEQVGVVPVFAVSGTLVDVTVQFTTSMGLTVLIDTTAVGRQSALPPTEVANLCF